MNRQLRRRIKEIVQETRFSESQLIKIYCLLLGMINDINRDN